MEFTRIKKQTRLQQQHTIQPQFDTPTTTKKEPGQPYSGQLARADDSV